MFEGQLLDVRFWPHCKALLYNTSKTVLLMGFKPTELFFYTVITLLVSRSRSVPHGPNSSQIQSNNLQLPVSTQTGDVRLVNGTAWSDGVLQVYHAQYGYVLHQTSIPVTDILKQLLYISFSQLQFKPSIQTPGTNEF